MNIADLVAALGMPASTRVDQRVPKKLLLEQGVPSASDKRQITEGIEEIYWLAALKANTVGIPEFRDESREYLEIAVLSLVLRDDAKSQRLSELIHRAVPYPVLLLASSEKELALSLAHKRWAQNESGKVVLDGDVIDVSLQSQAPTGPVESQFIQAMALASQPRTSLQALYQGWIDTVLALQAARLTGNFTNTATPEQAVARQQALQDCRHLESELIRLRNAAAKEKQLARQVQLNLELKHVQAQLGTARKSL